MRTLWSALSQIWRENAMQEHHYSGLLVRLYEKHRIQFRGLNKSAVLKPALRAQIDNHKSAKAQIRSFNTLDISYYPRESHLVTFRDPYSFPVLYHPQCNNLVRDHLNDLAQNVRYISIPRKQL